MIAKKILKVILIILAVILAAVAGLAAFLTATEFRPADVETLTPEGNAGAAYQTGDELTILTWNIGYAALGDDAEFFMDGGTSVRAEDEDRVRENMEAILSRIESIHPDIFLLQEVDRSSSRSFKIDEQQMFRDRFPGYESTCGVNYRTPFVPYPMPPLGKIDAGIMTFTTAPASSVSRIQLPVPFRWPVRTVNLKGCPTQTRTPALGPDGGKNSKALVIFNLHLEAYDSGEGKIAQTKMLADLLKEERAKGSYVIAGGDFNQIFSTEDTGNWSIRPDLWQAGEIDCSTFGPGWRFLMDETTPSCRSLDQPYLGADKDAFQYYLIDGFIVSDNIDVEELKNLDLEFVNADHNPVVMTFTLAGNS